MKYLLFTLSRRCTLKQQLYKKNYKKSKKIKSISFVWSGLNSPKVSRNGVSVCVLYKCIYIYISLRYIICFYISASAFHTLYIFFLHLVLPSDVSVIKYFESNFTQIKVCCKQNLIAKQAFNICLHCRNVIQWNCLIFNIK